MTIRILQGDCRDVLKTLPDQSVHCCITSPPYWGLRSYLPAGHPDKPREIGSEPTVQEWVDVMVDVLREVRRVLRDDGTLWLNLGDSYAANGGPARQGASGQRSGRRFTLQRDVVARAAQRSPAPGLKPKDLIGQPWRVAFALQDDGWYLRQEIIWAKKNPMPESVRDRFTKAHEHVFLLSKRERYYFDVDAVQEQVDGGAHARRAEPKAPAGWDTEPGRHGSFHRDGRAKPPHDSAESRKLRAQPMPEDGRAGMRPPKADAAQSGNDGAYSEGKSERMGRGAGWRERKLAEAGSGTKNNGCFDEAMAVMPDMRNPRSVRWLASEPFRGAHFATYPAELIRPFVLAGCPRGGVVLDPFGGSGTTGLVCDREGRDAILIDLDERNLPMARERITGEAPLFADVSESAA